MSLVAVLLLLLAASEAWAGVDAEELLAIPAPPLERMEPAVRRQLEQARAALDTILARDDASAADRAEAMGLAGQLYLGYGLARAAEACLRNAQQLDDRDFRWAYYLATHYQHERRLPEAQEQLERALALRPGDLPSLLRLGDVELARARPDQAWRAFVAAAGINSKSAAAHHGLARAALAQGDAAGAAEQFEAALYLQPAATALHYPLALVYRDLGNEESMREHLAWVGEGRVRFADPLAEVVQRSVTGVGPHLAVGHIALRSGDLAQAEERFRSALAADSESALAHQALATVLDRRGRSEEALQHFARAAALAPREPEVLVAAARAHLRAGRDGEAIAWLRAAAELAPQGRTLLDLAIALERTGSLEEAAERYRAAAAADPGDLLASIRRALVLERLGRAGEAAAELETVVAAEPRNAEALLRLARLRDSLGEWREAVRHYRALLTLGLGDEVDAGVHRVLAELLEAVDPAAAAVHHGEAARLAPQPAEPREQGAGPPER